MKDVNTNIISDLCSMFLDPWKDNPNSTCLMSWMLTSMKLIIISFQQSHVAVGRATSILERNNQVAYPDDIYQMYLHFEAMTSHSYDFNCIQCGFTPPVLIIDGHWKAAFDYDGKGEKSILALSICSKMTTAKMLFIILAFDYIPPLC